MKIYNSTGDLLYDIIVSDSSVRYRSIMNDDSLTLYFSLIESIEIPLHSYVIFEGVRYMLWRPEEFKKHSTRNHEYTLTLHGWREFLKIVKYKDMSSKPYRLKFTLTAKPDMFIQNLIDCLNNIDPAGGWTKGECIDAVEKTISFNHEYCLEALSRFANEWNTEYEFEGKKIHLRKVEKFKDSPVPLSYGKGKGFLPGVGRFNDGDKSPIGRLFVQGGERNIDFSQYGSRSLLLPKLSDLVYNGKTYRTDADGMYITRVGNNNQAEDSYDASEIYPKRVGTVSSVETISEENHFYDIIDSSIPEALDYSECRIAGEKATIKFESGILSGREFDIEQTDENLSGYIHAERRFKIVPAELDGQIMPGGVFIPAVGDKYAIFNISMPTAYISDNVTKTGASWDMFRESVRFFAENEQDRFKFTGELDGIYANDKWLEIGGKLIPGGHILFSDDQFQPQGIVIRIVGVRDYVHQPHKPELTLSNAPISGSFSADLSKIEADEVVIDEKQKEVIRLTKRQWRDTKETMSMLQKSMLNFSNGINPITIQTMQLLAGDESLQFRFVNSKTAPQVVEHIVGFDAETKILSASGGIIQHMTLGIRTIKNTYNPSDHKYWDMAPYTSPPLDPDKSYFLYAKCSSTGSTGVFLLSETAIKMNEVSDYYHFLAGILNSEFDNERSYLPLYGFTEILPGRVITDMIASADGEMYIDLVNKVISARTIRFRSSGEPTDKDLAEILDGVGSDIQDTQGLANAAALKAQQAIDDAAASVTDYNAKFAEIQAQVDGEISNYSYPYTPTLLNYPASDWATDIEKDRHIGDVFHNSQAFVDNETTPDSGKAWRFVKNGTAYSWTPIADSDAVKAIQEASKAQAMADGKSTTFLIQPTKYHLGDMWVLNADTTVNGTAYKQGDLLTATQDSETFNEAHWLKRVRYTDDTAINELEIGGRNYARSLLSDEWTINNPSIVTFERISNREGRIYGTSPSTGQKGISLMIPVEPNTQYTLHANVTEKIGECWILARGKKNLTDDTSGTSGVYGAAGEYDATLGVSYNTFTTREDVVAIRLEVSSATSFIGDFDMTFKDLTLVRGNKPMLEWEATHEDIQDDIAKSKTDAEKVAKDYTDAVEGALQDNIIDERERAILKEHDRSLDVEQERLMASVDKLLDSPYLIGVNKTALTTAKDKLLKLNTGTLDLLQVAIKNLIAKPEVSKESRTAYNTAYDNYRRDIKALEVAISQASIAINEEMERLSDEKIDELEFGFANLYPLSRTKSPYIENIKSGFIITNSYGTDIGLMIDTILKPNTEYTLSFNQRLLSGTYSHVPSGSIVIRGGADPQQIIGGRDTKEVKETFTTGSNLSGRELKPHGSLTGVIEFTNVQIVEGSKAPLGWSPSAEDVQARIDAEKTRINDILSDNIADPSEKQYLSNLWQEIYAEYPRIWAQANDYSVSKTTYEQKYTALKNILDPVLANLTINSTVSGSSIRTAFSQYYDARTVLQNAITNKVNQNAVDADAKAQALEYLKQAIGQEAEIDGALVTLVTMLLKENMDAQVTAFISGIQGASNNLPAFGAGAVSPEGAYADALAGLAKIIFRHDGTGKIGVFEIDEIGSVKIYDPDIADLLRLEFVKSKVPTVASLMSQTEAGQSKTNTARMFYSSSGSTTLPNSVTVTEEGAELSFSGVMELYADFSELNGATSGYAYVGVALYKDGFNYAPLGNISPGQLNNSNSHFSNYVQINKKLTVPKGVYTIVVSASFSNAVGSAGINNTSTLSWILRKDIRRFIFGSDGFASWYTENSFHFSELTGMFARGKVDIPAGLGGGRVTAGGGVNTPWGLVTGGARASNVVTINHNIGDTRYTVNVALNGNSSSWYFQNRTNTSIQVVCSGAFDFTLIRTPV